MLQHRIAGMPKAAPNICGIFALFLLLNFMLCVPTCRGHHENSSSVKARSAIVLNNRRTLTVP